jgi:hypothetical protein
MRVQTGGARQLNLQKGANELIIHAIFTELHNAIFATPQHVVLSSMESHGTRIG